MDFVLPTGVAVLERTPATLRSLLQGLPPDWTLADEGPATWSPFDIVGHLIHCERADWIPRARITLAQEGSERRFTPLDRFAQDGENTGKSLDDLVDEFARLEHFRRARGRLPDGHDPSPNGP